MARSELLKFIEFIEGHWEGGMSRIERFEDILAWQKARYLVRAIYQITATKKFAKDYGLSNQIQRSTVSIMSNIAEGFDRGGNKEFIQFLSIAKGSASEAESQLYVAVDNGYITQSQFEEIRKITNDVKSLISGFIRYLKKSDLKGVKYKV